jgi:hypothetical protein
MTAPKLSCKQVLYEPPSRRNQNWTKHVIAKVGRIWATLESGQRCRIENLMLDRGGFSGVQLYASNKVYEDQFSLSKAWRELKDQILYLPMPEFMTIEKIAQIRALYKDPR